MALMSPLVFDIKRFSLDDGPGIRTTVFLKGCPLSCDWCHNPESIRAEAEMAFHRERCIGCGECVPACPQASIRGGDWRVDDARCTACGRCAQACPTNALEKIGEPYAPDRLVDALLRDRHFFAASGGGVSFSGGEPTLHGDYLAEVLVQLKRHGIDTLIETCGVFDWRGFRERLLPHIDHVYFDVKLADPALHRRHTGAGNRRILSNLAALLKEAPDKMVPRVPLVPGVTDTDENLKAIGRLIRELGGNGYVALPFNPAAAEKRARLTSRNRLPA